MVKKHGLLGQKSLYSTKQRERQYSIALKKFQHS